MRNARTELEQELRMLITNQAHFLEPEDIDEEPCADYLRSFSRAERERYWELHRQLSELH